MLNWIKDIFRSGSGVSSMRVMAMISLLTACYIGIAGLYKDRNLSELAILCGTFLSAAMYGKVAQKKTEISKGEEK